MSVVTLPARLASFAFDRPEPIVEANIARVLARLTNWRDPIDTAAGRTHLWRTAEGLLPMKGAREHNSALMDLGAMICLPRTPGCGACPVRRFCRAVEPALLPRKKTPPATVCLTERHAFTRQRNHILLEQSQLRWQGMWILPRLASPPRRRPLLELDFPFTHHRVTLEVFSRPAPKIARDESAMVSTPRAGSSPGSIASPARLGATFAGDEELPLREMIQGQKLVVVMPAYNAARTLRQTYDEVMAHGIVDRVILVDDASKDETATMARALPNVQVEVHPQNRGYGGNQKTCYRLALAAGADIVIMIHPDYQYTPALIPAMASLVASGLYPCVLGSRILGGSALRGGMPWWKYVSNRVLTLVENLLLGAKLSEYHTGYRALRPLVARAPPPGGQFRRLPFR